MPKIIDGKVWHNGQKIGWIEGSHIRSEAGGGKLGYYEGDIVFNEAGRKVAWIHENELVFANGNPSIPLEHLNAEIEGTDPPIVKCAVHVLLEE